MGFFGSVFGSIGRAASSAGGFLSDTASSAAGAAGTIVRSAPQVLGDLIDTADRLTATATAGASTVATIIDRVESIPDLFRDQGRERPEAAQGAATPPAGAGLPTDAAGRTPGVGGIGGSGGGTTVVGAAPKGGIGTLPLIALALGAGALLLVFVRR